MMSRTANSAGYGRLHLGVTPWLEDRSEGSAALAHQGEKAEALGYDSFWLAESHFSGDSNPPDKNAASSNPSPLLGLAVVAARTERLAIGTTSFLLPIRHPIHAAEDVAVLDRLSGGRLILGVGRGFRPGLFEAFQVPAKEKRSRFEFALETMLAAWRGEPVAWDRPDGASEPKALRLSPLPAQRPHPPVWVAAFGPKAVEQAGRLGLPYLASPVEPLEVLVENYERHRQARRDGLAAELPVPVMRTTFTSRDSKQVDTVRSLLERQVARLARSPIVNLRRAAAAAVDEWAILGSPEAVAEKIERCRSRLGLTHLIVRSHIAGVEPEVLEASVVELAEVRKVLRT